jgi:hypothetical protein
MTLDMNEKGYSDTLACYLTAGITINDGFNLTISQLLLDKLR